MGKETGNASQRTICIESCRRRSGAALCGCCLRAEQRHVVRDSRHRCALYEQDRRRDRGPERRQELFVNKWRSHAFHIRPDRNGRSGRRRETFVQAGKRIQPRNGNLFGCQAWVALDNQYGTLKAGLQYSPFFLAVYESDPRDFDLFGSGIVNYVDNVIGTGIFSPNSVSYTSPELAGFQGSVLYSLGGIAGNFQAGRQYAASLKYELGGFMINASIFDANAGGNAQTPVQTALEFEGRTIGAAYKIGPVTAKLSFVNYKVSGSFNNNVYGGGLDYHVTPALDMNGGVWVTSDRNRTANHSVMGALGATYFVSKRTSFYAQVGAVDNQGLMNTGVSTNGATFGVQGTTVAALVGLRHTF
jgi:predicted porin